ncbi:alpha/beta hydrolase [Oculatella sp. LEGE 06141]|uniref:alpha/beta fold hydrolase n=1 Tax=Oculatella sp. LEGE 06141 TaxID=1828648 RepID=UPI0018830ACE|nr:alpha/beta hydrolase [Oculatella sp. LEGE 06141]MBE9179872.1 alpha/beta hydrolase [Oculatella sp. LEGE 06141]
MFQPPGFRQHSISTSLGQMVFYVPEAEPWAKEVTTKPRLVFLHGFGGGSSAYEWSKVYPAFVADYSVIAPDLLGWGRSDHLDRPYRIDDYLTTMTEFLEKTCEEPVAVVASSLTAAFVIRMAIVRPELFKSLILVAPAGLSDFGEDYTRSFFAQLVSTPILDRILYSTALATSGGIRNFLEQRQFAHPNRVYAEIVEAYLASAQQPNAEASALSFVRGDLSFDLALYLGQLTIPTVFLWGKASQFTTAELGTRLAALNPDAIKGLEILEDVGLTPQLELPAVTVGLIRKWLKRLTPDIPS